MKLTTLLEAKEDLITATVKELVRLGTHEYAKHMMPADLKREVWRALVHMSKKLGIDFKTIDQTPTIKAVIKQLRAKGR